MRGKTSAETEFGAKLSISLIDGYARVEKLSWDNYNEGCDLQEHVEAYRQRCGFYPKTVIADKIYRTRENLRYCRERNIRLSGPPLGRPNEENIREQKRQERLDSRIRNAVEGVFGVGKRRFGLGRIMAKLKETSESVIMLQFLVLQFLVMNLESKLRFLFYVISKGVLGLQLALPTPRGSCPLQWAG